MSWLRRLLGGLNLADLPLAWLQLKRQPIRYLVAVTGIGFAALLEQDGHGALILLDRGGGCFGRVLREKRERDEAEEGEQFFHG